MTNTSQNEDKEELYDKIIDELEEAWECWAEVFKIIREYGLTIEADTKCQIMLGDKQLVEVGDYTFGSLLKSAYCYWFAASSKLKPSSEVKQSGFISLR